MADDEDIAALVIDNGSGMCKGKSTFTRPLVLPRDPIKQALRVMYTRRCRSR
jgi:hypothetical protein